MQHTHRIIFKGEKPSIPITESEEKEVSKARKNGSFFKIDFNESQITYHASDIKDVEAIPDKDRRPANEGYRWICDYNNRHRIGEECECRKNFKK